jgi:hypothetical protein
VRERKRLYKVWGKDLKEEYGGLQDDSAFRNMKFDKMIYILIGNKK